MRVPASLSILSTILLPIGLAACDGSEQLIDADGDGFFRNNPDRSLADCDDDPRNNGGRIYPGAQEVCDGVDNDCDGEVDEADALGTLEYWPDADGDGFGVYVDEPLYACVSPLGYSTNRRDCNDNDGEIYPSAPERCNDLDDDCDLEIDEGIDKDVTWYADLDGDGYGKEAVVTGCPTEPGLVRNSDDCSDISSTINPDAVELCDDLDNDCDGLVDDEDDDVQGARLFWTDADGDGYGNILQTVRACEQPFNAVTNAEDCDDTEPAISPESTWYLDADWDGHGRPDVTWPRSQCEQPIGYVLLDDDCDDSEPLEFETKPWFADADRDGFGYPSPVALGCDPDPLWVANGDDCDDRRFDVKPGADEICDLIDNDCNGAVDDEDPAILGQSVWYRDDDGDGAGRFYDTVLACFQPDGYGDRKGDCNDDNPAIDDAPEWYLDDDRDGFGDPNQPNPGPNTCERVPGYVPNADDCDDGDFLISPRTPWFVDLDGDGVGDGFEPVVRACTNPDPQVFAPVGGDCNDGDASDDVGGCYGDPVHFVEVTVELDQDTEGLELLLTCGAADLVDVTLDAVDAGLTLDLSGQTAPGTFCFLNAVLPEGDPSGDGGPKATVYGCGGELLTEVEVGGSAPPFWQAAGTCGGCADPTALNYDPSVLVARDVCYYD